MNRTASPKTPKYWQLVEQFRQQIDSGELRPGDRLPSLAEMKEQGISRPVMEKVHQILESEGLILRQPGSGTFVCEPKKRQATGILGFAGWGFHLGAQSSYWGTILTSMREAAKEHGFQLLLLDHSSSAGWEKADGILLCDYDAHDVLQYVPSELPCVSVLVPIEDVASVYADDCQAACAATEYLLSQGHRRIAYLYRPDKAISPLRLRGYEAALRAAGIEPDKSWLRTTTGSTLEYGAQFIEAGENAMRQWLENGWKETGCTALIAHNDEVAIGAMSALRGAGISVPEEVSLIGFDGLEIGEYVAPRLTTMKAPLREIGRKAVELLCVQIEADKPGGPQEVLPMQLRVRDSVAPPRGDSRYSNK